MYKELEDIGIILNEEKKELFSKYMNLFIEYNSKVNLISNNDEKVLFEKHIFDSLAYNLFLQKYNLKQKIKIMDIGTGGGFPSLPIAMFFEKQTIVALDSINKKINFIKYAAQELNIKNINPICSRVEDLPIKYKNHFDVVVTRAMADLRIILEYAIPYIKVGGYFVAYKSLKADAEIENAKNALKILNCRVIEKIEYSLPIETENKRVLLIIKKDKEIPSSYPRKNGLAKKKPL